LQCHDNGTNAKDFSQLSGSSFKLIDGVLNKSICLVFNKNIQMHWYTVKTVSQSEKGVDLTDQCICLLVPFSFVKHLNENVKICIENAHV